MTKYVHKHSSTAGSKPTAADLERGEIAVNLADKKLFTKDASDAIVELGSEDSVIIAASAPPITRAGQLWLNNAQPSGPALMVARLEPVAPMPTTIYVPPANMYFSSGTLYSDASGAYRALTGGSHGGASLAAIAAANPGTFAVEPAYDPNPPSVLRWVDVFENFVIDDHHALALEVYPDATQTPNFNATIKDKNGAGADLFVDYGDGHIELFSVPGGNRGIDTSHQYANSAAKQTIKLYTKANLEVVVPVGLLAKLGPQGKNFPNLTDFGASKYYDPATPNPNCIDTTVSFSGIEDGKNMFAGCTFSQASDRLGTLEPRNLSLEGCFSGSLLTRDANIRSLTTSIKNASSMYYNCVHLASASLILNPTGTLVDMMFAGCSALRSLLNANGQFLSAKWMVRNCSMLTSFSFNANANTRFCRTWEGAFDGCALSQTSVDNILAKLDKDSLQANSHNILLGVTGGTNATPGANGLAAITSLTARGWTITHN